ncbi:MAG: NAD(P)H-hydrate dehydratase [Vampirovibrionia bacterium]
MKIVTGSQMAQIDRKTIDDYNIDGLILMENAGLGVYSKVVDIIKHWDKLSSLPFKEVVIVAGKGNNGGDGFVIARHLVLRGIPVTVFASAERADYSGDALKNYLAYENFGDINLITDDTLEDLRDSLLEASIVVDALLGTGIKGNVEGRYAEIIDIINETDGVVVSVDIPSGVLSDTGEVGTVAVEADFTVTFAAPKLGLYVYPGAESAGEIDIINIGIPDFVLENFNTGLYLTTDDFVFNHLPWRPDESHKGTYGKVLTVAGSNNMSGAGLLSAYSVLKTGAGLSNLASPASLVPHYAGSYPELTFTSLNETFLKSISSAAMDQLRDIVTDYNCVVLGPGIGTDPDTVLFVKEFLDLLLLKDIPVVLDADALNCLARCEDLMLSDKVVITPHPKELSRIMNIDIKDIIDNKINCAKDTAQKYSCNVLLKGANSLIVSSEDLYINPTGNSALATAGSGDVLSGIIAGLIAQGLDVKNAAICGAYIHGLAGEIAAKELTEYSVVATDIINNIPKALHKLSFL